ncbi:MAG: universal stress protein [Bacteroidetes bacterium]|jgi:nucleotide-binding universal stress UspA family protein|nr:universal stress protein [Bacteroidota bacterium]
MKTFIVPIDFSEESLYGLQIAQLFSGKFTVNVQMVNVIGNSKNRVHSKDEEMKLANRKFEKLVEEYAPQLLNDSKLRYIVKKGKVYKEVVNQAHSYKDAIIAASTHGVTGFKEAFIGSNTYKIISATSLPVLTIRKGPCPENFSRIVLPITSHRSTRQKVPFTKDLAKIFNSEIHILQLHSPKNTRAQSKVKAYSNQVKAYLNAAHVNSVIAEAEGDIYSDLIVNYAEQINADLISIMSDKVSRLSLILGNYAHQTLAKSDIPVLCISPRILGIAGSFSTYGG